jgi:hypothetical protein
MTALVVSLFVTVTRILIPQESAAIDMRLGPYQLCSATTTTRCDNRTQSFAVSPDVWAPLACRGTGVRRASQGGLRGRVARDPC